MELEEFIKKISYLDNRIIEGVNEYLINERLVDWYEHNTSELNRYRGFLKPINISLRKNFITAFTSQFDGRSNCSLIKIIKSSNSESWFKSELNELITKYSNLMDKSTNENNETKKTLLFWRDKFFFHIDETAVDKKFFNDMKRKFKLSEINNALKMLVELHKDINKIKLLYNFTPKKLICINTYDIDLLFIILLKSQPPVNTSQKFLDGLNED